MSKIAFASRTIAIISMAILSVYIFFANTVPLNISRTITSDGQKILALTPASRITVQNGISTQTDNLLYFYSKMPFKFDRANVKVTFKNPSSEQQIFLGYRDQKEWHYNTQLLDDPILDNLQWSRIGNGPYLYQKTNIYNSTEDFLKSPPDNKVVGVKDFRETYALEPNVNLPNYTPAKLNTSIDVPLRGKTTMYVYLKNEPFNMSITKRDLNWYEDPDSVKISVYKAQDKVFDATIDDDGNSSRNHKIGPEQTITIKNPGPELPESGVYRITIDAPIDSVVTNITTNLQKLVFEGPLYVVDNHDVYGEIAAKTKPTTLITNAQNLNFRSDHKQSTEAFIDKMKVNITKPNEVYTAVSNTPNTMISIPKSDMIINGGGYFAFTSDQYFAPTPFKILPINNNSDIAQTDFILTNYKEPVKKDGWLVSDRQFNISNAHIIKGQLGWVINTPGLKENNRTIEYKQLEMTLTKKGWFKN